MAREWLKNTTALLLLVIILPACTATAPAKTSLNRGTFADPSVQVRPKFRYWVPDASIDPAVAASDVQAAGEVGAAGLELLGYYLYGGPPEYGATAAPVDWATYGFGTPAWHAVFQAITQAHKDNHLIMDFAIGPNQGTGVPAPEDSDGLMWDIAAFNVSVPIGSSLDGVLPGWGTGALQAAVAGTAVKSESASGVSPGLPGDLPYNRTQITLAAASLLDVTEKVDSDGHLSMSFPTNSTGLNHTIFAVYLIHSDYRAQDGPEDLGGPQTTPQSYLQNGSWAVDHFSGLGAQTTTNFWERHILNNGTRQLLESVAHYAWEDSVEIDANVYWTKNYTELFQADHGYSIPKWLPILFHRNGHDKDSIPAVWWVTDEPDGGDSHLADYRQTLGNGYQAYLSGLNSWAQSYLGLNFSAQISYNLPMDMLENVPSVDVPECETLDFGDLIDGYRQYSGPAYLAAKPIVSSECGAVKGEAYIQTLPELLWHVKRSYAGSVNQFLFHGFPYSGDYGNTTWPVFTTFDYGYSCMHGPHEPAWDFYRDQMDYVARNNFVLQSGVPSVDIAFWQKLTTYPGHITNRTYEPTDLEDTGYSYDYLSPSNLELPTAYVQDGVLAPEAQAFKAMVIRANDSLTVSGVTKLVGFANAGLPIVLSGGVPTSYLGINSAAALAKANSSLYSITTLPNVHLTTSYSGLASTLSSIGIMPATKLSTNGSLYTAWRQDNTSGADYIFVYNDAMESPPGSGLSTGSIQFSSSGVPYHYDAWTGNISPILTYNKTAHATTIPLQLAGNQSTLIAFHSSPLTSVPHPQGHLATTSLSIISVAASASDNGSLTIQSISGSPCIYTTSDLVTHTVASSPPPAVVITNWTLIVEHWDPPSNLTAISAGANKHNTTHHLSSLVPWSAIPGLQNVSGRGFYNATFQWPVSSNGTDADGAVLSFESVYHTLRASVNGHALPALDVTDAKVDVGSWLVNGTNKVEAVVATPLGNVLRPIWNELLTSGTAPPATGVAAPPMADYGLRGEVNMVPYVTVEISI